MKKYIYSALALTAAMGFTACQSEEDMASVGNGTRTVTLTLTADRGDLDTRTSMSVENGDLVTKWESSDKLIVTNENETGDDLLNLGVLDLIEGAGKTKATFSSTITIPSNVKYVHVTYLGKKYTANLTDYKGDIEYSVASQSGDIADLTANDVLTSFQPIEIPEGSSNFIVDDITLTRHFSYGYFELKELPFTLVKGDVIKVTSPDGNLKVSQKIGVNRAATTTGIQPTNAITITKGTAGNTFYLAMIPQSCSLLFEVTKDGYRYTATLGENTWKETEYYRLDENNTPISISKWKPEELPTDLYDMSNWGAPNQGVNILDSGNITRKYTDGGYVNNNYSIYITGGWCTPATFKESGIVNGYLYSTHEVRPSYYQWGRWIGFPDVIGLQTLLNSYGQPASDTYYLDDILCLPFNTAYNYYNKRFTYVNTQYGSLGSGHFYRIQPTTYTGGWDNTMAVKASHIFAVVGASGNNLLDYLKTNESCTWESRSGNPCPTGYRIPTKDELGILIPDVETISGTYAMVKKVDGRKIAMKWEKTTVKDGDETLPAVKITSIETNSDQVSVNDAIFNSTNATHLILGAYGYLNNLGAQKEYGTTATIWSNESGTSETKSGNGGVCLRIEFSGNTMSFSFLTTHRVFALPVVPIRDKKAVPTSIQPWFPAQWNA